MSEITIISTTYPNCLQKSFIDEDSCYKSCENIFRESCAILDDDGSLESCDDDCDDHRPDRDPNSARKKFDSGAFRKFVESFIVDENGPGNTF